MKTTEVFTSHLPVGEKLSVKRTRFEPKIPHENMKRISSVVLCQMKRDMKE